jgi:alpha-tubulin suppressor-like RCC1 family protein
VKVNNDEDWAAVSAGGSHSLALKSDGTLWAWGANSLGQLGDGTSSDSGVPVLVDSDLEWARASAGGSHSLALIPEGALWAWGMNDYGQLGDGTEEQKNSPVLVRETAEEEDREAQAEEGK